MRKRVYLFIDGTNLYAAQYELFGPSRYLSFPSFIDQVEKKLSIEFDKIYFYASYSPRPYKPNTNQKKYLLNESSFYRSVRESENTYFFKGFRSKSSGKEKGVDVKLALDAQAMAYQNRYDTAFLFSGDQDLLQVIDAVKEAGKSITVINLFNKLMYKAIFKTNVHYILDTN